VPTLNSSGSTTRTAVVVLGTVLLLFTLYTSATIPLHPTIQRGLFLLAIIALGVLLHPLPRRLWPLDVLLVVGALVSIGYLTLNWEELAYRANFEPILIEYLLGFLVVGVVLEVTRRAVGLPLTLVAIAAIFYARFGAYLPEPFTHKGYNLGRLVVSQYLTHEGLFGSILGVAATLVAMFILFGCLLQFAGVADLFMQLAARLSLGAYGGPAKLAVTSSALFGTISGSSTANVVTTGMVTIPLMKRVGYRPEFAGAVEAVASTGGQIMPPVMGVAAFLMAEVTGIPYITIAIAAVVPALLYYAALFVEVDLEARRLGLRSDAVDLGSGSTGSIVRRLPLLAPLGLLVYLLLMLYSPTKAAFMASVATVLVALPKARSLVSKDRLCDLVVSFAKAATSVGLACAAASVVVGALNLTGVSMQFSYVLVELAGESWILLTVFVMLLCTILGMGLPTPAAYAVAAAFAAPMLTTAGVSKLAAHLFVLYYASLSSITPPVAIAAYAAAGLAGSSPMLTGWLACRLGLAGFIVPFMFLENNALLLGQDRLWNIVPATVTALIGVSALAVATIGYLRRPIGLLERGFYFVAAILLIHPSIVLSLVGFGLTAILVALHAYHCRREARSVAPGAAP
jgi:TRAP transporter 4TM/12TM fusion protein